MGISKGFLMLYKVTIKDCCTGITSSFTTCSEPKINYCGGYLGVTGMRGFVKIGSNFSIEVKEVKEKDSDQT